MRVIAQARKCRMGCRSGVSCGWGIRDGGKVIKGKNRGEYVGTKWAGSSTEYHSKSGNESETGEYMLSSPDQWNSILHVRFPMPYTFPKPYLTLNEVLKFDETSDHVWNNIITEDPDEALRYIINHFHVDGIAKSIHTSPDLNFEQVYYSTYIETRRFTRLQHLIDLSAKKQWHENALAQQRLAIQKSYSRYASSDDLSPYLLQCLL